MIDINSLPNVSQLQSIESHFRVFAGPGSGKTKWLIEHLHRLLKESKRLGLTKKIACITYTSVAADEIQSRLKGDKNRVDVSTIHSFLYFNVIKPFAHLIEKDKNGDPLFNIAELNGHQENIPHSDKIRRWQKTLEELNNKSYNHFNYPDNALKIRKTLAKIDYFLNEGKIEVGFRNGNKAGVPRENGVLWEYKKKYWSEGILHHEDVLFFTWYILTKSPRVVEFIRSKYPYLFIDEFQDTTSLQTWFVYKLAQKETKVGVIGDVAQSIYKFAGAKLPDFENFLLPGMNSYKLEYNYRSTPNIVHFLNRLRTDIRQIPFQTTSQEPVRILVGTIHAAIQWLEKSQYLDTVILTQKNRDVELIKQAHSSTDMSLLHQFYADESDPKRAQLVHQVLAGSNYYKKKNRKEALNSVIRPLKKSCSKLPKLTLRREAIMILGNLENETIQSLTLFDYYNNIYQYFDKKYQIKIGAKFKGGKGEKFYQKNTVRTLQSCIAVDTRSEEKIRTIHSSKGTEFTNVLVHLSTNIQFMNYVIDCSTRLSNPSDEARMFYVAFSRAKQRLFINIPIGSEQLKQNLLQNWQLEYIDLSTDC
ncbi:ATP-dependent helicase [Rhodocytophaga aerolata]|uniref:DNA 3'-5' helicase n=1 Tax=Rhodocytophaga aerolata TaxID=455078 RepID=A0ABT8QXS6_9BACT|nr:ATP-dependent helicase [Rhodocytophaga aerolata]MDO1444646.1 ATP-dependent helicase [Rhodocytophaga aerolata]